MMFCPTQKYYLDNLQRNLKFNFNLFQEGRFTLKEVSANIKQEIDFYDLYIICFVSVNRKSPSNQSHEKVPSGRHFIQDLRV